MGLFENKYPYTDFHELNLDWFLEQFKGLVKDWDKFKYDIELEWNNIKRDWTTLYNYVHDYFDNLDVQKEIDHKLDEMLKDGSLASLVNQYIPPMPTITPVQVGCIKNSLNYVLEGFTMYDKDIAIYYVKVQNEINGTLYAINIADGSEVARYNGNLYHGNSITCRDGIIYVCYQLNDVTSQAIRKIARIAFDGNEFTFIDEIETPIDIARVLVNSDYIYACSNTEVYRSKVDNPNSWNKIFDGVIGNGVPQGGFATDELLYFCFHDIDSLVCYNADMELLQVYQLSKLTDCGKYIWEFQDADIIDGVIYGASMTLGASFPGGTSYNLLPNVKETQTIIYKIPLNGIDTLPNNANAMYLGYELGTANVVVSDTYDYIQDGTAEHPFGICDAIWIAYISKRFISVTGTTDIAKIQLVNCRMYFTGMTFAVYLDGSATANFINCTITNTDRMDVNLFCGIVKFVNCTTSTIYLRQGTCFVQNGTVNILGGEARYSIESATISQTTGFTPYAVGGYVGQSQRIYTLASNVDFPTIGTVKQVNKPSIKTDRPLIEFNIDGEGKTLIQMKGGIAYITGINLNAEAHLVMDTFKVEDTTNSYTITFVSSFDLTTGNPISSARSGISSMVYVY